jgi:1-acyl-sn-glycerol-3-phosphate acyltransferase
MRSRFSPLALRAFESFFLPWQRRRLAATLLAGLPRNLPADLPLVLASSHVSWWDAFTLRHLHRALRPAAPVYTAMTERELRRFPFFRLIGVFGIDPESAGAVRGALRFWEERTRERRDSTLIYFPQGRIWPSHRRPLGFQRGVELFARRASPCAVLPVALHHEPLSASAPTVFAYAGEPMVTDGGDVDHLRIEQAVEAASDALLAFVAEHGEETPRAWPGPFGRLPAAPSRIASPAFEG